MKIIIDIPEEVKQAFDNAKNEDLYGNYYDYNSLIGKAIRNGTPLPKGHGRLIDADEYKEHLYACETNGRPLHIMELDERLATVDETPTIIEADKEE